MQHHHVEYFRPQVNAILNYFYSQKALPKDDLEQEMWLKLILIFPKFQTIPEDELQPYVFTALRNQVYELLNDINHRSIKMVTESQLINDLEFTFDDYMDSLMWKADGCIPSSTELAVMGKDMEANLSKFITTLSPAKQKVLNGLLWPDAKIMKHWVELQKVNPMYKQFITPPANTIGKILGVSNVTTAKAVNALKTYMRCVGYA